MSDSSRVIHPFFQLQQQKKPNTPPPPTSTNTPTHVVNNLSVYQPSSVKTTNKKNEKPPKKLSKSPSPPPPTAAAAPAPQAKRGRPRKAKTASTQKTQQLIYDELQPMDIESTLAQKQPVNEKCRKPKVQKPASPPPPPQPQPQPKKVLNKAMAAIVTKKPVASCSKPYYVPIEKPKFYSDTLEYKAQQEYDALFNFYGLINKEKRYDTDFSRLDRSIYGHAHVRSSSLLSQHDRDEVDYTSQPKSTSPVDLGALISDRQQAFFQSAAAARTQHQQHSHSTESKIRRFPKNGMHIETQADVEAFLDLTFPQWHTFPACVILSQLVFNKSNHRQTNQQTSWNDKYRPKSVNGLLGERHNSIYLKDWLHQMKIEPMSAPTTASGHDGKGRKKKKKKAVQLQDLDGLSLQDDDDDDDFMPVKKMKTAKQLKKESMRSNIILLSGDHGVGKTASVYTAADQLGYEVFEINSGTRRSGKDIMSMVGEMTKSHLVAFGLPQKFFGAAAATSESRTATNSDPSKKRRLNPCLSSQGFNDPPKGDGLLKHFLRKKEPSPPSSKPKQHPSTTNEPKQSLILLEEVDLLFEEDKGFWTSVIELSQKSKRPIIMTCNDPDQIPFENLCLQVVLEIKPPSEAELLPYLWLVCYSEGYIVDPADLMCLMAFLGRDVRQLIQTLELYAKNGEPIFEKYLSIDREYDPLAQIKTKCVPSRVAVDTYRLARHYGDWGDTMEDDDGDDDDNGLERIEKALENNSFTDAWLTWKENGNMIHESVKDQINGFTSLWLEDDEESESKLLLQDLESSVSVMNSASMKSNAWRDIISDGGSHWDEVCDTRSYNFEDYTDAIMKLLTTELLYRPKEQVIMMEYIPYIKQMILADSKAKTVKTRSKRKRLYLPLSEESVDILTSNRPLLDETQFWIERLDSLKKILLPLA